jgi:hypothetical protein
MKLIKLLRVFLVTGPILIISAISIYFFSNKMIEDNVHKVINQQFTLILYMKIIELNLMVYRM